jgi:hypothetical protein
MLEVNLRDSCRTFRPCRTSSPSPLSPMRPITTSGPVYCTSLTLISSTTPPSCGAYHPEYHPRPTITHRVGDGGPPRIVAAACTREHHVVEHRHCCPNLFYHNISSLQGCLSLLAATVACVPRPSFRYAVDEVVRAAFPLYRQESYPSDPYHVPRFLQDSRRPDYTRG